MTVVEAISKNIAVHEIALNKLSLFHHLLLSFLLLFLGYVQCLNRCLMKTIRIAKFFSPTAGESSLLRDSSVWEKRAGTTYPKLFLQELPQTPSAAKHFAFRSVQNSVTLLGRPFEIPSRLTPSSTHGHSPQIRPPSSLLPPQPSRLLPAQ